MMLVILGLWVLILLVHLVLAGQPLSADAQIALSMTMFVALIVIGRLPRTSFFRVLFCGVSSFMVLRYLIWRSQNTIPPVEDIYAFVPGIMLYGAEVYAMLMFFISLFIVIDPMRRPTATLDDDPSKLPTVDVFVPTYDEDPHILAATLSAASRMRFPKHLLTIYLLDDGGTDQKRRASADAVKRGQLLEEMCRELGVRYLTRERNEHAKAGNLNAALPKTRGEFIAVLDADHAPTEDFLENTVGHFATNPKLFLVQTPHFFINPDPLERNLNTFDYMPGENEMFYGVIQRGLDRWGASFFCGSAAVLRRQALEQVGGFSGRTIVEDCETSIDLHSLGWESIYIDKPMIAGLQPETFSSFMSQRIRWGQGMVQIFLLKNPLFRRGLDIGQRLGYLSSNLFWFFGFARLTFFLMPLFYLFFGLAIYRATAAEFLAYTTFYIGVTLLTSSYLFGRTRWPLLSELYEFIQATFMARALISVMLKPTAPSFNVTAKGETVDKNKLSQQAKPLFIITGLLTLGLIATVWRYFAYPDTQDIVLVVGGWNLFGFLLAVQGLRVVCERKQVRRAPRVQIEEPVALMIGEERRLPAYIVDASIMGVKVLLPRGAASKEDLESHPLTVSFVKPGQETKDRLRIQLRNIRVEEEGIAIGAEFVEPTGSEFRMIAELIFISSNRWVAFLEGRRARSPGVVVGVLRFLLGSALSIYYVARFLLKLQDAPSPRGFDPVLEVSKKDVGHSRFSHHPMEAAG
ncbi:UDP-forming cellulose synthase catalytic subunit [Aquibaculum sediminis]|uniref:UDP-forming cellulose synthase catalytic subunit n=1 Tax=Aquibaculum sediminis TaxID=3231907 RepID=UPI0034537B20